MAEPQKKKIKLVITADSDLIDEIENGIIEFADDMWHDEVTVERETE